jgi:hypothetical protein
LQNNHWSRNVAVLAGSLLIVAGAVNAQDSPAAPRKHGLIQVLRNPDGTARKTTYGQFLSGNWSGYSVANFETNALYTSASLNWTVPTVTYDKGKRSGRTQVSAIWVGIGGFCENSGCTAGDETLIQLGTQQDVEKNGTTDYYPWYEVLPASETPISETVKPGDQMTASLTCTANCTSGATQTWALYMQDITQGWTFSINLSYASSLLSADYIIEATESDGSISALADYGVVTLTSTTADGINPGLVSTEAIYVEDSHGETGDVSTPVGGDAFNGCWDSGTTFATCNPPTGAPVKVR